MSNKKGFFARELTSKDVERKGQKNYKLGKIFMFCGLCGFILMLLTFLIAESIDSGEGLEALVFACEEALFFSAVSWIGILLGLIGIGLYNIGINRFALGRIAVNTENNASATTTAPQTKATAVEDELPEL